ncbi:MAG TPA: DUF3027 domain-containing protein [Pseudonocardiaceae bacterium]|nr:DUF3027 domain-containing protein [Pseudonocardiaceae bacterium]
MIADPTAPDSDFYGDLNVDLHEAVELARQAAQAEAGDNPVGEHVQAQTEDGGAVTHLFDADLPGYRGWRWAVTVASAGPGTPVTVDEVVLLPGPHALVAPPWLPWTQRLRAGDLGAGDLLPTDPDDPRLVPGYLIDDDPVLQPLSPELGLGRLRVLSRDARLALVQRWRDSDRGPDSEMARSAPDSCVTCGFYLPLGGLLAAALGVCGNDLAPADGQVVHAEFGCGAHSEVRVDTSPNVPVAELVYDDAELELLPRTPVE